MSSESVVELGRIVADIVEGGLIFRHGIVSRACSASFAWRSVQRGLQMDEPTVRIVEHVG